MAESISKRNVRDGADVVKKAKGGKNKIQKGELGGGSFQSMGLHPSLLRSLTLQGFRMPTPIQRLAIPALLAAPPRDLVGMARTGSGKSLAYMVPLVQRLGGRHATTFGARALILLPTRELALQVLRVGKELARGFHTNEGGHAGDKESTGSKTQALRWGLIVGGEGMDEQFEMITSNPDIIIATPGRLLHLVVEMNLDLKSVQYVVFDEADRLFEMGFETALTEILQRLPEARQTLLFSATLPKSLVEFAKAGLQNPKLVRLDAESKISSDLKMAFFSVKQAEKDAALLALLRDVIKVPLGFSQPEGDEGDKKKRKGKAKYEQYTAPHQTLIFAATKHHVEYLSNLLTTTGFSVSHIYGALDQMARTEQMDRFRRGITNLLVVTDVAARGIDIPVLENVVNYDFPQGARVFVHRVGRTARAGRQGWAWSFVTHSELPYLLDLQLFLGRPMKNEVSSDGDQEYTENLVFGTFARERIDEDTEYVRTLDEMNHALPVLRQVMLRGQAMYERSKGKASAPSHKRAKEMIKDPKWMLGGGIDGGLHPVLMRGKDEQKVRADDGKRKALLRLVSAFRPSETVLETGGKANSENAVLMAQRRKALQKSAQRALASTSAAAESEDDVDEEEEDAEAQISGKDVQMADEEEILAVFDTGSKKKTFKDEEFYMSHYQKDAETEKGYSLSDGATFAQQASNAAFDLTGDEVSRKKSQMTWDKKKRRFIKGDGTGADNQKMVRTESGVKLPASYRSGRFDEWKQKNRVNLPRVGDAENETARGNARFGGKKFKHNKVTEAKPMDKLRTDYERKSRQTKKKGPEESDPAPRGIKSGKPGKHAGGKKPMGGRYGGKTLGKVKNELKNADQVRKDRRISERKREKNARPSHGKKRR
ncbi:ATP-dependent RNA helicase DBP10 [Cylindrobasidium torrendii FP15055 ss-10]|uniref:RNA helicase n=1 Tax=Cylindrobasidium torrendii FP15055 ss-10 TaxID=1314674 RepID=A0A0D7BR88_9AGAR|nr:ATP-dependent RNA helicase DBP10 [Cylindrobasidium torrendii FP15055 ss-10]